MIVETNTINPSFYSRQVSNKKWSTKVKEIHISAWKKLINFLKLRFNLYLYCGVCVCTCTMIFFWVDFENETKRDTHFISYKFYFGILLLLYGVSCFVLVNVFNVSVRQSFKWACVCVCGRWLLSYERYCGGRRKQQNEKFYEINVCTRCRLFPKHHVWYTSRNCVCTTIMFNFLLKCLSMMSFFF